jgi:hypothetical protein
MKKFVAILLVLMFVTFSGVGRVRSAVGEVFCQVPLSVFSRSPAGSFYVPVMVINKGTSDMYIQKIKIILQDGTNVLEETLSETLTPSSLQGLTDEEIRNSIGIVQPDEKNLATAQALITKAATMTSGEERTRAVETAWLLLSTNVAKVEAAAADKLLLQARTFSVMIPLDKFPKKIEPSEVIPVRLDITIQGSDGSVSTISQTTNLFYLTSLPSQWGWYPGDGHLHSNWSDGLTSIDTDVSTASYRGLKWTIITDHAGDSVQSPSQPRLESSEWTTYGGTSPLGCTYAQNSYGITVCPGEELTTKEKPLIGAGGSHLLTYKNSSYAESYDPAPQTLINRAINAGGFGIIAHPYNSSFNWSDWHDGPYTGFRGIELISSGTVVDATQIGDWDSYLRTHLSATMQDPNHRFCVGLAGSDYHGWPDYLGTNMTYIYTGSSTAPGIYRSSVYTALESGRVCASSNGSLLVHKITTGGVYLPGYYMQKSVAGNITVNIYAASSVSVPSGGYAEVEIITSAGTIVTDYVMNQTIVNKDYSIYVSGDNYVRVQVTFFYDYSASSSCFTSPTFIDFAPYNQ